MSYLHQSPIIPAERSYSRQGSQYINPDYFRSLLDADLVVDASAGGLILGPSYEEGGIALVGINPQAEIYVAAHVEGWIYALNIFAAYENQKEVDLLKTPTPLGEALFFPYQVPEKYAVIDARPRQVEGKLQTPVLFYSTNQISLLAKSRAKSHLSYLDRINREAWQKQLANPKRASINETAVLARFAPQALN